MRGKLSGRKTGALTAGADLRARDYELLLPLELAFAGGHFDLAARPSGLPWSGATSSKFKETK